MRTYQITFEMPGNPEMTQRLFIEAEDTKSALARSKELSKAYQIDVYAIELTDAVTARSVTY